MPASAWLDHYRKTYQQHLARLRAELGDEDKAVVAAVGGEFQVFGRIEYDLLRSLGLRKEHSVIDIGCGCGRLPFFLREYSSGRYTGIDVIPELVDYARRKTARTDWEFIVGDGSSVPEHVPPADCICFFSVLTHLTLEDCYRYLEEARRFLKPDGFIVLSFLDFTIKDHWAHFGASLTGQGEQSVVLQYLNRDLLVAWAAKLGLQVCGVLDCDRLKIPISEPLRWTNGNVTTGTINMGQSVAVLGLREDAVPGSVFEALGQAQQPGCLLHRELLAAKEAEIGAARAELTRLTRVCEDSIDYARDLKTSVQELNERLRALEDELALEKGRRGALAASWLPGRHKAGRLPSDAVLRARAFGDNGADLHGPAIDYYLFTSPYRLLRTGKQYVSGWCSSRSGAIRQVRIRLDDIEFPGTCAMETRALPGREPRIHPEQRSDGFLVPFELPSPGRHFLRIEALVEAKGWSTFVSCPVWAS